MFKLRKTRQKLALSLTPLGAVRGAAVDWKKIDFNVWENPVAYLRLDSSSLYGTMRSESETAAQSSWSSCSHFESLWKHSGCLSSACLVVCAVNFAVTPAENFVSPLCLPPLLRVSIEKKVSVAVRQSVHPLR